MTLKRDVIRGVAWSFIDKGGVRASNFIIGILIARLLTPTDYGLIGMIMVFITISNLLIDSGISQALIQKKDRSQIDYSTAFFFNITVAIICYIILFIFSPIISEFYGESKLDLLLKVLGLNIIIISFATVQKTRLIVNLDFKKQAIANVCGVLVGGITGLIIAYRFLTVWAIIAQQLCTQTISTILYWVLNKWMPSLRVSIISLRRLWNFGAKLLTAGLLSTLIREGNALIIGKVYRPAELGYYSRAVQTSDMFAFTLNDIINSVTYPVLSRIQEEEERFNRVYLRMLQMTAFCIFPFLAILSSLAKPLFLWLLTDKWALAIPLFQWLCIARMATPLTALNMNILNAKGLPGLVLKLEFLKMPVIVLGLLITIPIGVKAIVIGNLFTTIICYMINVIAVKYVCKIPIRTQLSLLSKIIILCVLVYLICTSVVSMHLPNLATIILGFIVGGSIYVSIAYILRLPPMIEIINILRSRISSK